MLEQARAKRLLGSGSNHQGFIRQNTTKKAWAHHGRRICRGKRQRNHLAFRINAAPCAPVSRAGLLCCGAPARSAPVSGTGSPHCLSGWASALCCLVGCGQRKCTRRGRGGRADGEGCRRRGGRAAKEDRPPRRTGRQRGRPPDPEAEEDGPSGPRKMATEEDRRSRMRRTGC